MAFLPTSEKVLIEAFGLPGSGKTTFIERMLAEPQWSEKRVWRYRDVTFPLRGIVGRKAVLGPEFLLFRLINRRLWSAVQAVADSLDYEPRLIRQHKTRILKECFFITRALRLAGPSAAIVLDQGPIQAVWHLICYSRHVDREALKHLLKHLDPWVAQCSLLITTNDGQAVNRVKERGGNDCPFDRMDSTAVSLTFRNHLSFLENTVPNWLAHGGHVALNCSKALRDSHSFAEAHQRVIGALAKTCEQHCLAKPNYGG